MSLNGFESVIELGDLSPETRQVAVQRPNPKKPGTTMPVRLTAYVNGTRTYLERVVAFSAARAAWIDATTIKGDDGTPVLDPETGQPKRADDPDGVYWTVFLSQALNAVIPELTADEAMVLAYQPAAVALLEDLGWFRKRTEEPADPEAEGEGRPIGDGSSPDSASTSTARART